MIKIISVFIILTCFNPFCIQSGNLSDKVLDQFNQDKFPFEISDFDPLVDLILSFDVHSVRNLKHQSSNVSLEITINDISYQSPVWLLSFYKLNTNFSIQQDIPDSTQLINISIRLIDDTHSYDLTNDKNTTTAYLIFDIFNGTWYGDDYRGDQSGYGRLNGCDDGFFDDSEYDAEICFSLYLNDYDHDGIPYFVETDIYHTDPTIDDTGKDYDDDGIPIEYEFFWGFDPFAWNDFENMDNDTDGLNGFEEYMMDSFDADPFRPDIFVEIDQMEPGPNQQGDWLVTSDCITLLTIPFHKRNIILHIPFSYTDIIPYDQVTNTNEVLELYDTYFLDNSQNQWKRGIFRYGLVVYHHKKAAGKAFIGEGFPLNSNIRGINSFLVSKTAADMTLETSDYSKDFIYATYFMHELGHTMGLDVLNPPGCDNKFTVHPVFLGWWKYANYQSVMNYRYVHTILDYSDGSHGKFDFDDWNNLDLTWFEEPSENQLYVLIQELYERLIGLL